MRRVMRSLGGVGKANPETAAACRVRCSSPASAGNLSITAFVRDRCPLARTHDHAEAVLTHRDKPRPPAEDPRTAQVPAGQVKEQA